MFTQREDYLPLPPRPSAVDRRWKPNVEIAPNCPRCNSSNTKFCYYNNYSLTQPRYFCKSCRRYWTKGGSLRNVPIGGGCRKNRRGKSGRTVTTSDHVYTRSSSTYGNSSGGTLTTHEGSIRNPYLSEGDLNLNRNTGVSDSSNIDLAVVYAKFLNQGTDSDPGILIPEFDSSFDLLSISNPNNNTHFQFSDEQCVIGFPGDPSLETQLSDEHPMLPGEPDPNYMNRSTTDSLPSSMGIEMSNYDLEPLPTEELLVHDMFWSNSPIVGTQFNWHTPHLLGFEEKSNVDHQNLVDDNWSSFDLSNF